MVTTGARRWLQNSAYRTSRAEALFIDRARSPCDVAAVPRYAFAVAAVGFLVTTAALATRAVRQMSWGGPIDTVHGPLVPPTQDGDRWLLVREPDPVPPGDAAASRARVLQFVAARGLKLGEAVVVPKARPPVPSIVKLTEGGYAVLLGRAPHVARVYDPSRGDLAILDRQLGDWFELGAEPLLESPDSQ